MLLGKHCSISGGIENACDEAFNLGLIPFRFLLKNKGSGEKGKFQKRKGIVLKKNVLKKG